MKRIHLYGYLKDNFGPYLDFEVNNPQQALSGLIRQIKGFREALAPGQFQVIRGSKYNGLYLTEESMYLKFGKDNDLHIIPVIAGAKDNILGVVSIVLGVALIGIGIGGAILAGGLGAAAIPLGALGGISFGTLVATGVGLLAAGVSVALSPRPELAPDTNEKLREKADDRPSFLFDGPVNRTSQGGPVPIVYGRMRVGSIVISSGLQNEVI